METATRVKFAPMKRQLCPREISAIKWAIWVMVLCSCTTFEQKNKSPGNYFLEPPSTLRPSFDCLTKYYSPQEESDYISAIPPANAGALAYATLNPKTDKAHTPDLSLITPRSFSVLLQEVRPHARFLSATANMEEVTTKRPVINFSPSADQFGRFSRTEKRVALYRHLIHQPFFAGTRAEPISQRIMEWVISGYEIYRDTKQDIKNQGYRFRDDLRYRVRKHLAKQGPTAFDRLNKGTKPQDEGIKQQLYQLEKTAWEHLVDTSSQKFKTSLKARLDDEGNLVLKPGSDQKAWMVFKIEPRDRKNQLLRWDISTKYAHEIFNPEQEVRAEVGVSITF